MTHLITRLQSLTSPSREIDAEIALACGWTKKYSAVGDCLVWRARDGDTSLAPPRFTKSLDAVLTLVSERWNVRWHVRGFRAEVWDDDDNYNCASSCVNDADDVRALTAEIAGLADELAFWRYQAIYGRAFMLDRRALNNPLVEEMACWKEATKQLEAAWIEDKRERYQS